MKLPVSLVCINITAIKGQTGLICGGLVFWKLCSWAPEYKLLFIKNYYDSNPLMAEINFKMLARYKLILQYITKFPDSLKYQLWKKGMNCPTYLSGFTAGHSMKKRRIIKIFLVYCVISCFGFSSKVEFGLWMESGRT